MSKVTNAKWYDHSYDIIKKIYQSVLDYKTNNDYKIKYFFVKLDTWGPLRSTKIPKMTETTHCVYYPEYISSVLSWASWGKICFVL